MNRVLIGALAASRFRSPFAMRAAVAAGDPAAEAASSERRQHWVADHRAMMDARLGCMKEVLRSTANQYPLREVFENAVRKPDNARMDDMREITQTRERVSPSNVSTQWQAVWVGAPPKLRASPPRPNRFTTAPTILSFAMLGREMLTAGDGPLWEDSAGEARGTWLPAHWDWKQ
jgi:hypothetical protein